MSAWTYKTALTDKNFWLETADRAVKTTAQSFVALATAAHVFDVLHADWAALGGVSLGMGLVSVATSVASAGVGVENSPSII